MSGLLRLLGNIWGGEPSPPNVVVLQQRPAHSTILRSAGPRIVVKRNPQPYWQETGWRRQRGNYTGEFHTRHGQWSGLVKVSPGGRIEVYILNPPAALENHPHWDCFNKRDGGWFFIHPTHSINDVSAAILNVEKTITESYEI
jgi:hypothetical protein